MKRIQSNLAYLASLADRKMTANAAKGPSFLSAPALSLNFRLRAAPPPPPPAGADPAAQQPDPQDPNSDREERFKYIRELYGKLQSFYPGIDYTREPAFAAQPSQPNQAAGAGAGGPGGAFNNRAGPGGGPAPHGVHQGSPPLHSTPQMGMMQGPPGAPQGIPMA